MNPARRGILSAALVVCLAACAAYHNSFSVPFIFDDPGSIADNPTIRHLWPIRIPLSPPPSATVSGRPILNLSLAVNYAISGTQVWSYHAANLLIHILAGLALLGIVRRTLERRGRDGDPPTDYPAFVAFAIALLWTVHPLQTESVTYIIQRGESLMGLFYLLTLYCFIRMAAAGRSAAAWAAGSVLACALGMATKEVMVSAPVIVFLYDRTFVGGSFRGAWRARRGFYLALAGTWLVLAWLILGSGGNRAGTLGFGVGVPWWMYAAAQFKAICLYLRMCFWPHPLVLDYGRAFARGPRDVLPYVPVTVLLVGGTAWALWRRPGLGFLGMWILAILAPTSSVIPGIRQTIAEHRMYLPLAAVIAAATLAGQRLMRASPGAGIMVWLAAAIACVALTLSRNRDYGSQLSIWRDTAEKRPGNEYAHYNLAMALSGVGRIEEAVAEYREAVRLRPDLPEGRQALAVALEESGHLPEAIAEYREVLLQEPDNAAAEYDLGNALARTSRPSEAIAHFERALFLRPGFPEAQLNLGNALLVAGRTSEAIAHYEAALRLRRSYPDARNNLIVTLRALGRYGEAQAIQDASGRQSDGR